MSTLSPSVESLGKLIAVVKSNAEMVDKQSLYPAENLRLLGESGFLGLLVPRAFGGAEVDAATFVGVVQQIAAACASTGMVFVMHCCAIETIVRQMNNEVGHAVLEAAARGKHLTTLACSERSTGANFYASFSTSTASGGRRLLNGEKCFVTSGGHADSYIVPTRAPGSEDSVSTTIYLVPKDAPGLSFAGEWKGIGLRGNSSIVMLLNDCSVAENQRIGEDGKGLEIEMGQILPRFLLGTAAVYAGIGRAAYEAAREHVKKRGLSHTAETLADLAVVRRSVGEMKVALDAAESMLERAAKKWESGDEDLMLALLELKQFCCQASVEITRKAMQACGGIAYSASLPLERHMRDALAGPVMAPTNDMLLDLIGRAELGLPLL